MVKQSKSRRRLTVVLLAALTLFACAAAAVSASAAGLDKRVAGPIGGVVPSLSNPTIAPQAVPLGTSTNLEYGGGPLLLRNTTRVIYWEPSGSKVSARYHSLVQQFLGDVAADSGRPSNPFAVTTQYDNASHEYIKYSSTYGGAYVDTDAYPTITSGCKTTATATKCVTREQQENELETFLNANKGLPRGLENVYLLLTPEDVNTCYTNFSWCGPYTAGTTGNEYCAYHTYFELGSSDVTWANLPYGGPCGEGSITAPNERAADYVIQPMSHELSESITDPKPGAGWDNEAGEIGDKCNASPGPNIGTTSGGVGYDVLINHHPYDIQSEWSNAITGCAMTYGAKAPTASFSFSNPAPEEEFEPDATSGSHSNDPGGYIIRYEWNYGDGTPVTTSSRHVYSAAGTYTVSMTVTDDAGLTATTSHQVVVALVPTATIYTGSHKAYRNVQTVFTATLKADLGLGPPLAGGQIVFTLGTQSCTATTNAAGEALCEFIPTAAAESLPLVVSYAGSASRLASSVTVPFTLEPAPQPVEISVTNITATSAAFNAVVKTYGNEVRSCRLRYFTMGNELTPFPCPSIPNGSTTPVPFTETPTNLTPGQEYSVQLELCIPMECFAAVDSFRTPLAPPGVQTEEAAPVTQTVVQLNGLVTPNGQAVTGCEFEYGPGFGTTVPCEQSLPSLGSGNSAVPVSVELTDRTPGESIEYRVAAANASGSSIGTGVTVQLPSNPKITLQGIGGVAEVEGEAGTLISNVTATEIPASESPPSGKPIIGELAYEVTDVPADGKTTVTLALPPGNAPTVIYKRIDGKYINISSNHDKADDIAKINKMDDTVTIELEEGGFGDTSTTKGVIEDPLVPVYEEPPTVTEVSPGEGPAAGETQVTITGTELMNTTAVEFAGVPATSFKVESATVVSATTPAGAGIANVTVTTPGGTSPANTEDEFTYEGRPVITGVSPTYGLETGGSTVTISGLGLAETTALKFGSATASDVSCSETECSATAPAGSGTVEVTALAPGGASPASEADHFSYVPAGAPPRIKKLDRKNGPAAGGTTVTITGTGFVGVEGVSFGSTPAENVTVTSPRSITAIAPPGTSGKVDIRVTTANGVSPLTFDRYRDLFRYANPIVEEIEPSQGPRAGGNAVTILGSGFAPGDGLTRFFFGKTLASSVVCESTRVCTLVAPKGKPGIVDVVAAVGLAKSETGEPEESGEGEGEHFEYTYE